MFPECERSLPHQEGPAVVFLTASTQHEEYTRAYSYMYTLWGHEGSSTQLTT